MKKEDSDLKRIKPIPQFDNGSHIESDPTG